MLYGNRRLGMMQDPALHMAASLLFKMFIHSFLFKIFNFNLNENRIGGESELLG